MPTEIIATGDIRTDSRGYQKLIDFYDRCCAYRKKEVLIEFKGLTWIDANMSALLMAIINKLQSDNNLTFVVDPEVIRQKFNILIRNGWLTGVEFIPNATKSAIKLTGFDIGDDGVFLNI